MAAKFQERPNKLFIAKKAVSAVALKEAMAAHDRSFWGGVRGGPFCKKALPGYSSRKSLPFANIERIVRSALCVDETGHKRIARRLDQFFECASLNDFPVPEQD